MAKKQVYCIGLLPSRRALKIIKLDARRALEMATRVASIVELAADPGSAQGRSFAEAQKQTLAMCVRGITLEPVELKFMTRPPTAEERVEASKRGNPDLSDVQVPDIDATLAPFVANPNDPRWTPLGEMQLLNDHEDNELGMFSLFEDPGEWAAVLSLIDAAGGGALGANPFQARVLRTSAG